MRVCRKYSFLCWLIGFCVSLAYVSAANGQVASFSQGIEKIEAPAVPGVVIVKLKSQEPAKNSHIVIDRIMQEISASEWRPLFPLLTSSNKFSDSEAFKGLENVYEVRYDAPLAPRAVANLLIQDGRIEYAEPRYLYSLSNGVAGVEGTSFQSGGARIAPNDPQYSDMSHLRHVNMPEAWDVVKASEGNVVIGIVDGGVDWEHPDLRDNVWRNTREVDNGVDDDRNGLVDDLIGWNFPDNSNDPIGLNQTPFNGQHGTMVAGIASAVTDNSTGISGASWNAKFIPINAGCTSVDNAVCFGYEGMLYAARAGADIINVSWGGPDSFLGREIVRIVQELGSLVIASAGNGGGVDGVGLDFDRAPTYPASYEGVFVVGATGKDTDSKAVFSNFGLSVDVFAPGENLNSTFPGNDYTTEASGTSFAVPFVSGLAALVKTQNDEWTMQQVREQIRVTSISIDENNDVRFNGLLGSGRIDALRALTDVNIPSIRVNDLSFVESDSDGGIQEGEAVDVTLDVFNYLAPANGVTYSVSTADTLVTLTQASGSLGEVPMERSAFAQFSFQLADAMPDDHRLRFTVSIQGDGFSSTEVIDLTANRITHDTGVLQVSITDEGNIGWSGFEEVSEGQGFNYFGVNWLFEGGLLVGISENNVLSSIRSEDPFVQDEDFERIVGSKFGVIPGTVTSENGLVILGESDTETQHGIRIHQESYADNRVENANFIILRYLLSISDTVGPGLNDVYIGLFTDWDLTTGGDFARYDETRRLGIVQSQSDSPILLLGTQLLTPSAGVSYRSIRNSEIFDERSGGDGFTDQEKWTFLSGGIQTESVDDDDVSTLIAAGPYRLFPDETVEVAFALVAATSTDNMSRFADNAQVLWDQTIRNSTPNPVSVEDQDVSLAFNLESAYPNPAYSNPAIRFTVPQAGRVNLELYDILGRKIRTLLDEQVFAGVHTIEWDRKTEIGNVVSSGTYVYRLTVSTGDRTYSAAKPIVVIH